MHDQIETFLDKLDQILMEFAKEDERLDLYVLGRSALVLHYGFRYSTTDIDIVWMRGSELEKKAIDLMGKDTALARSLGLYLDLVPQGLPPLPRWFRQRAELVPAKWKVLRLWKLEIHDLAATKLKSFRAKDREDLQALCDRGLLRLERLRESLDAAFPFRSPKQDEDDPDNPDWELAYANLQRVESYLNGRLASI